MTGLTAGYIPPNFIWRARLLAPNFNGILGSDGNIPANVSDEQLAIKHNAKSWGERPRAPMCGGSTNTAPIIRRGAPGHIDRLGCNG